MSVGVGAVGGSMALDGPAIKFMKLDVRCNVVRRVDVGWEGSPTFVGLSAA